MPDKTVNIDIRLELLADRHPMIKEYLNALRLVKSTGDLNLLDRFLNNKVLESDLKHWTEEALLNLLGVKDWRCLEAEDVSSSLYL
jgi:hypothetical protein